MGEEFDVAVVGLTPAGGTAAVALAREGRRVWLGGGPPSPVTAGGLLNPSAVASDSGSAPLPVDRRVVERRLAFLDDAAGVALEYYDSSWPAESGSSATFRESSAEGWWTDRARASGVEVAPGAAVETLQLDTGGRVTGVRGRGADVTARLTVLTSDGPDPPARPPGPREAAPALVRAEAVVPLGAGRIDRRFSLGRSDGLVVEFALGFFPEVPGASGYLYTRAEDVVVGVAVPSSVPAGDATARSGLAKLLAHPSVAPYVEGVPAILTGTQSPRSPAAGEGFLVTGSAHSLGGPSPAGIPTEGSAFRAGALVAEVASGALAAGDVGRRRLGQYLAHLKAEALWSPGRPSHRGPAADPRLQAFYPRFLASTLHELMTETGGPKRRVVSTVLESRRRSGRGWGALARDAVAALRSL